MLTDTLRYLSFQAVCRVLFLPVKWLTQYSSLPVDIRSTKLYLYRAFGKVAIVDHKSMLETLSDRSV